MFLLNSSIYSQCVFGDCENSFSIKKYPDSSFFEGLFQKGQKICGINTYTSGSVYKGNFQDNKRHGEGLFLYKNQDTFQEELPKTNTHWDLIISKSTKKDIVDRLENCSIFKDFFLNKEQNNISENINDTTEKTIIKSEFHQDSNIINHYQKDGNKTIFETDYYVGQMIDNGVVYKYDRENKFLFLCNLQIINKYNWFEAQNQENSDWILPQISDLEILYKHKKDLKLIREELYWSKSEDYFRNGWAYPLKKERG